MMAQRACELTKWSDAGQLAVLAAAYAELGDLQTARMFATKAAEKAGPDAPAVAEYLAPIFAGRPVRMAASNPADSKP